LLLLPLFLLSKDFLPGSKIAGWPRTFFIAAVAVLLFTPLSWMLAIRLGQFRLMGLVLLALAVSISGLLKSSQVVVADSESQGISGIGD
jgi:hypothetical protein